MKRFLWAAILALLIHGFLFGFGGRFFNQKVVKPRSRSLAFTLVATEPRVGKTKAVAVVREKKSEKTMPPEECAPKAEKVIPKPAPRPKEKQIPAPSKKILLKKKKKTVRLPSKNPVNPKKKSVNLNSKPPQPKQKDVASNETSTFNKGLTSEQHHDFQPKGGLAGLENAAPSASKVVMASPAYAENPIPGYPRVARKRGYQGIVLLKVLVSREGRVDDLLVLTSSGYDVLDRSAVKAVGKWRFEPGNIDGKRVTMWVKVPVKFELKGR